MKATSATAWQTNSKGQLRNEKLVHVPPGGFPFKSGRVIVVQICLLNQGHSQAFGTDEAKSAIVESTSHYRGLDNVPRHFSEFKSSETLFAAFS